MAKSTRTVSPSPDAERSAAAARSDAAPVSTQRGAAEPALEVVAQRQAVLANLGLLALGNMELQPLLEEAVARLRTTLDVDACTILELLPGGDALIVRADLGWNAPMAGRHTVVGGVRSQAGYTLLSSEPVVVDDVEHETRFGIDRLLEEHQIRSGMTVIIHGRERPFGILGAQSKRLRRFTREDVDYFQAAANVIASAVERRRTEEELRRSEASFRSLIEHSPEAILVSRERIVCYVNHALVAYLGYDSGAELLGRSAFELVHPEDRGLVAGRLRRIDSTGAPAVPREMRFLRRDGTSVLAESIGVAVMFDGKPAIAAMIRDVAERRKLEARLHLNDRLASLGTLAAGVAHEVNNPLTYVLGNLELIRGGVSELRAMREELLNGSPEASRKMADLLDDLASLAENARDGGEKVRTIVSDLKSFSRGDNEDAPAPVNVRDVLRSAVNVVRNQIRFRAQLHVEYGEIPLVAASEARLGQVFMNLLVNAAQAIPEGAAHDHQVSARTLTGPDGRAVVEISDTGSGIAPEILTKLFDPFFTTKPFGVGTGLGLSICHNIVAGCGGEITVESEPGKGSCFRVLFPPAAQVARAPATRVIRASAPRARVLIIDDDPFVAGVCKRFLGKAHDVSVLHSGDAALEHLETEPGYDVIFCDLLMPGMTGMDLFEALEKKAPELLERFVFLSGGAFTAHAKAFRERVSNLFLDKPCTAAVLLAAVDDHLRRAGQRAGGTDERARNE